MRSQSARGVAEPELSRGLDADPASREVGAYVRVLGQRALVMRDGSLDDRRRLGVDLLRGCTRRETGDVGWERGQSARQRRRRLLERRPTQATDEVDHIA